VADPRVRAPDFTGGREWFNVAKPLSLKDLRGKIVLLDFWTYGCINCMHIIPDLKRLEEKYSGELVVIGVHSAKFANERKADNIRHILVRYDITHPVVNDADFAIWRAYGARAWPTQVLIDPEGYVVATASGEGKAEAFDQAIAAVAAFFDEKKLIDRKPLPLAPERLALEKSTLAFPGKVLADEASGRLFVADSNHHRVLVCDLGGKILDVAGSGHAGFINGSFEDAAFYRPQGMAIDAVTNTLLVADTENHAIRALDLAARRVTTFAGTGDQAPYGAQGGGAREMALNSPWDLALAGRLLFIAMAGSHQIWLIDLDRRLGFPYAGSGREARADGGIDDAALAQPSGLALSDRVLYVADSESNIIRAIDLPPVNQVRTLAGGDLFEFGDRDGNGDDVRLQHPLGIAVSPRGLVIADTYNHKVKTLDPATGAVRTFVGTGEEGRSNGHRAAAQFYEPGGISATSTAIYVADTNNHAIRRIDLASDRVETLSVQ
jgi:DNA-binding beta-propeller fold protein YncE